MSKDSSAISMLNKQEYGTPDERKKMYVYREERHMIPSNVSTYVKIQSKLEDSLTNIKLINVSRFGVSLIANPTDYNLSKNEEVHVTIKINDCVIYNSQARIINERHKSDSEIILGLTLNSPGIDLDHAESIIKFQEIKPYSESYKKNNISHLIDSEFKTLVADLHTILQTAKAQLLEEEAKINDIAINEMQKSRLEEQAITSAISIYTEQLHTLFRDFQSLVNQYSPEKTKLHKQYFRVNFHPLVLSTPFISRAFNKPLGYAGDYGLMLMFYDYRDIGKNLFDKFFHRFSCNEPSAVANKNRVEFLSELLFSELKDNNNSLKITSVACGPAKEICLLLNYLDGSEALDVTLIDTETQALDHAREQIRSNAYFNKNSKLATFSEDAVLGIIKERPFVSQLDNSNVIVSAGLFDYLSDRVAEKLIDKLYNKLAPGGKLIIGNVSKNNPDQFSMSYFMEWILVLRDENDLLNIVPDHAKKTSKKINVVSENLGLNLFLIIEKEDEK